MVDNAIERRRQSASPENIVSSYSTSGNMTLLRQLCCDVGTHQNHEVMLSRETSPTQKSFSLSSRASCDI